MGDTSTFFRQHDRSWSQLRVILGAIGVSAFLLLVAPQARGQSPELKEVMNRHICMACHAWDKKLVGPPFAAFQARYGAGDMAYLADKIRNGSDKVWGVIPMPPSQGLSHRDAEMMAAWIVGTGSGTSSGSSSPVPQPDDPLSAGGVARMQ